jgi:hypothetical protein
MILPNGVVTILGARFVKCEKATRDFAATQTKPGFCINKGTANSKEAI